MSLGTGSVENYAGHQASEVSLIPESLPERDSRLLRLAYKLSLPSTFGSDVTAKLHAFIPTEQGRHQS